MRSLDVVDADIVLAKPRDVPQIWRDALLDVSLKLEYICSNSDSSTPVLETHPFHRRFSVDTLVSSRCLAFVTHYIHTVPTGDCYTRMLTRSRRVLKKNREALADINQEKWLITASHARRLTDIATETGDGYASIKQLDMDMRQRRANWDPSQTVNTPTGRSFVYLYRAQQWLDISYTGQPLSSSLS
jgi:hypothetical protein